MSDRYDMEEDVANDRALLEYRRTGSRRARDAAVERYVPLARSLARRYRRGSEPLEDLEQVACLALIKAVDAFDPSHQTAFSSYAVPCITGALKRHFRDHGWAVRVPRELQELALRVNRVVDELSAQTGRSPTPAEVAEVAGIDVEDVLSAREAYRSLHAESIDQPRRAGDGEGLTLLETLPYSDTALPRAFERVLLDELLEGLGERERTIVRLYYREELTQAEIGRRLGYSQMHISRLLRRAHDQLRLCAVGA
jgi:RNA polymerase sigma-B factor